MAGGQHASRLATGLRLKRRRKRGEGAAPPGAPTGDAPARPSASASPRPALARPRVRSLAVALGAGVVIACLVLLARWPESPVPAAAPDYVGSTRCAGCHASQHSAWQGSHHARAMQHATAGTVLGDFG
ncbi:MAG: hypothetical protein ACK559_36765, partial [bacterium]